MESRYSEDQAQAFVQALGVEPDLALRTYTARLLGADPSLVLHGGGNTSVKTRTHTDLGETVEVIHVKGSGWDLSTIEPPGHPALRLEPLRRLRALDAMSDERMVNQLRLSLLDANAPTPSVETLLHAFLPAKFIDHTHADAILSVCDQPDGEQICRDVFGDSLVWVPYVMPGFHLAKRCAEAFERASEQGGSPRFIVLQRHGLFTYGETARESYERTIEAVTKAERFIGGRRITVSIMGPEPTAATGRPLAASDVLPRLRGIVAKLSGERPEHGPMISLVRSDFVLGFLRRRDAYELARVGCATPDHVLRTKPNALFVRGPAYHDLAKLTAQLEQEITQYARRYDEYFAEVSAKKGVTREKLAPWPAVVLLPGFGLCAIGKTRKEASIAAEIYEHTIKVMIDATSVGTYAPVSREDLFDVEYWSLEQAKLKKGGAEPALFGSIALVTGGASGIGRATAARLLSLGAHCMVVDRDAERLEATAKELSPKYGPRLVTRAVDVTDPAAVAEMIAATVEAFGGLDVVVSNAGNAPEGRLDTEEGEEALRRSLELNLLAHNYVARAASQVMLTQGRGGCLLFNCSKSAFNPGPSFGPYAVAKASLVALMRQYAVDLGPHGVRSNAVNADRIRTRLFEGGVVESRAAARGLSVEDYFRANLLGREVTADDVANAFAYLADAPATTGCVVTVDGGNAAAFPR